MTRRCNSTADDYTTDPFNIRMFTQGIPSTETLSEIISRVSIGAENDLPIRQLGRFVVEVSSNAVTQMNVQMKATPRCALWSRTRTLCTSTTYCLPPPHLPIAVLTLVQNVCVVNGVQFGDLAEFCDFEFNARVARVNGVALWSFAQAPGTPQGVDH
ncbi:hypothetical protein B0H19DRAFT_1277013 [Mycena capillaripes]|nr:hypothetical protein B0H19DRAFT_1277013 [Mycena capillaripes]